MRLRQLDYLRGIAVLLVLGRHFFDNTYHSQDGLMGYFLRYWQKCGWAGVDLFFVLSGFLVSGLLFAEYQKTSHLRVGRFLLRRGLKIYPAFYVLLIGTAALFLSNNHPLPLSKFASEILYIQNYGGPLWQHTWSLAVEEHFYVLLAIGAATLVWVQNFPRRLIVIAICVGGMAGVLVIRIVSWNLGMTHYTYFMQTQCRIDALLCGVLISYVYHYYPALIITRSSKQEIALMVCGLGATSLTLLFGFATPFMLTFGLTVVYLGFAAILLAVLSITGGPRKSAPASPTITSRALAPLAFIGVYSYSIYLWHIPVRHFLPPGYKRLTGDPIPVGVELILYLAGSIAIGYVMAKLIEMPVLHLRDRYFPSATRPTTIPAAAVPIPVSAREPSRSLVH